MASSSPPHGTPADDAAARNEFARFTHEYLREQVMFADQKAAALFATATALLAYQRERGVIDALQRGSVATGGIGWWAGAASVALLTATALLAMLVVVPRLGATRNDGLVFWRGRSSQIGQTAYASEVAGLTIAGTAAEVARHAHDLAVVCRAKYDVLSFAMNVGAFAFASTVLHVALVAKQP